MSFGGQNNTPWQRNNMMQNQMSYPQQQIFMQQQQNLSGGFGGNFQSNSGSVGYQQRGLNPVAFSSSGNGGQSQHYNSIGTVTKMNGDCGLVNDEVFFYRNVCKGQIPQLGDRVLFEASISTSGQYKWDATRIQLMGQQAQPPPLMGTSTGRGKGSGYNAVPPPNEYDHLRFNSPRRSSPNRERHERSRRENNRRSRDRDDIDHDRKRRREDNDRNRDVSSSGRSAANSSRTERDRDESKREREKERSPHRSFVKGRKARVIRRYVVQIPKSTLVYKSADTQEIRQRFYKLYIPSDFFNVNIKWSETFTPDNPFSLRRPCQFHIMHKIVEPPYQQNADELEPSDADYIYSAKVMLLGCPPIAEIYQKCFEDDDSENAQHNVHPSRLITFLVGTRGRHEPMAIGGPWSPSMDGKNPDKDPAVLIRTAIRTCKALTGIDLSNCTQWYRFMEIHYHRADYKHKKKDGPPRVETVVIYVPDVHSCMPTTSQWQNLAETYKTSVDNVIARNLAAAAAKSSAIVDIEGDSSTGNSTLANDSVAETDNKVGGDGIADKSADAVDSQEDIASEENMDIDTSEPSLDVSIDGDDKNIEKDNLQPTHYSKLDLKNMKVKDIRDELMARRLPYKGVRNMIMARLAKAINMEKSSDTESQNPISQKECTKSKEVQAKNCSEEITDVKKEKDGDEITENKSEDNDEQEEWADIMDMRDIVILDEYDSSKNPEETNNEMDEKEKSQLIRRYSLPNDPHIIVHPNKTAKDGKFDCTVMSLSVLLDYRPDDAKERFFEISLFAELFNEMLIRDFGFNIYKELYLHEGAKMEVSEIKDEINKDTRKDDIKKEDTEKSKDNLKSEDNKSTKSSNERKRKTDSTNLKEREKEKDNTEKDKEKEKEKAIDKKMVVVKPHLLLSFIYFDTTHCGYIFQKDLEELFHIIGLNLSRGQIRGVLEKVSSHQICYRKLTDKEESLDAPPTIQDADEIPAELLKKIALGNRHYDFIFGDNSVNRTAKYSAENGDGLINYNGAIVHVGKLVEQIKRTELNYSNLETIHNDLLKLHADLQKDHTKSNAKVKDLQSEVKSLNRKLSETNQELNSINRKHRDEQATLLYIYNRVSPYFREKEKDKEKEHSAREKDIQKSKEKDKNKEKDTKDFKEKDAKDGKDKNSKDNKEKEKNRDNQKETKQNDKQKKSNNTEANLNNGKDDNKSDIKDSSENIPNKETVINTEADK